MKTAEIARVETEAQLAQCLAIRRQVFVAERGVPEEIEKDEHDRLGADCPHYLILKDGTPAGTLRVLPAGAETARLQRFAVLAQYRRGGLGRAALEYAEDACRKNGVRRMVLDAQCEAVGFYQKCGYVGVSDVFLEAGLKHIKMEKVL